MEVIRISELPEKSSADVSDIVPIVDVSGYVTKRTTIAGLIAQAVTAWWNGSAAKTDLDGVVESMEVVQEALQGKVDVNSVIDGGQY